MFTKKRNRIYTALLTVAASICVAFGVQNLSVNASAAPNTGAGEKTFAQTGLTVVNGSEQLSGVLADPVNYKDVAENGMLVVADEWLDTVELTSNKALIFTAQYPYTTTKRTGDFTEYTVEKVNAKYVVTGVNEAGDGSTYIPVGGYVLSLADGDAFSVSVGDELTVDNLKLVSKAVESDKGARIAVDSLNSSRSDNTTVYYDYDYGVKTGTNKFGTEMTAVFDGESGKFIVTTFRAFGVEIGVEHSGSEIPDNGFVISSCGADGVRGRLQEGSRFDIGDKLTMVGFDYLRFGGEPTPYTYTYDYYNADSSTDEFNSNSGRWEFAGVPFPAYRGTNQTIIYHDGWSYNGKKGTGTNVYGHEVAVDAEGVVVEKNVNVSQIPAGGYVISGHGKGRDFIQSSIPVGATIELDEDNKTFYVSTSLNSFYVNTEATVNAIVAKAETKIEQLYDVNVTLLQEKLTSVAGYMNSLSAVKEEIEDKDDAGSWVNDLERTKALMSYNSSKLAAERIAYEILALTGESQPVTARSVWHRPTEKTVAAIETTMQTYQDVGINLILVETFYNGYSLFKSDYVTYHKDFAGANYGEYTDYLDAFTKIAQNYGIEVHAWVEDFYVGLDPQVPLLAEHPDWIMYNNEVVGSGTNQSLSYVQKNEGEAGNDGTGYIFIDPANDDVQDFLINYYKELLQKNPLIKGLNLDYIRYPVTSQEEDSGYTKASMMEFATLVGVQDKLNPSEKIVDVYKDFYKWVFNPSYVGAKKAEENYKKWCEFRTQQITDFVERIVTEVKSEYDILLSTSVFSSLTDTIEKKKQDWQTWFKNGWIDIATPMAYFDASADVLKGVNDMILAAGSNSYYYTGLASSYRSLPAYENVYQIEASYMGGANGYVIFCSTQVVGMTDVQAILKAGFNSKSAVLPHDSTDKVVDAYLDTILDRADRLYLSATSITGNRLMTEAQKSSLATKFDALKGMDMETAEDLIALRNAVKRYTTDQGLAPYASGYAAARIKETMTDLYDLLLVKINLQKAADGTLNNSDSSSSSSNSSSSSTTSSSSEEKSGCGGVVGAGWIVAALGVSAIGLFRKKKEN